MAENVDRNRRRRNIRACNKCGEGHYRPKDDACEKILGNRDDGRGVIWILPAEIVAGRRQAPRHRVQQNHR